MAASPPVRTATPSTITAEGLASMMISDGGQQALAAHGPGEAFAARGGGVHGLTFGFHHGHKSL